MMRNFSEPGTGNEINKATQIFVKTKKIEFVKNSCEFGVLENWRGEAM